MLYIAGYDAKGVRSEDDGDIVDPMCSSGSLLLEAALLRHQIAPGLLRRTKLTLELGPIGTTTVRNVLTRGDIDVEARCRTHAVWCVVCNPP